MQTIARSARLSSAFIILLSLATVFFRLGSLPLIGSDEPRYARVAQEMAQDHHWVTPTLEFKPWFEKPPLYYWITVPIYSILGTTETAARMGPALLALAGALSILWLGTRLWSRIAGLMGASILLTSLGYVAFARGASTDMPMTGCLTVAMAILAAASVEKDSSARKVLPAFLMLGLSVLAKGPVAIALAAGVLLLFWLFDERGGVSHRWHLASGMLLTAAVSLPWFWLAFQEHGFSFIATFFINHNFARYVTDIHHHRQPFYYYAPVLLGLFFPWTPWLLTLFPSSVPDRIRDWRNWKPGTLFLLCWTAFPPLFFSPASSKLSGYILPSLPPLSLLLGIGLAKCVTEGSKPRLSAPSAWLSVFCSAGVAVALPFVFKKNYGDAWGVGLLLSAAVLAPAFFGAYYGIRGRWSAVFASTLLQGVIVIVVFAQFAFPVLGEYDSTREIARQALANDRDGAPIVTYHFFQHTLYYYCGYRIAEDFADPVSLARFAAAHKKVLVVTDAVHGPELEKQPGLAARLLGTQGDLRLLEVSH